MVSSRFLQIVDLPGEEADDVLTELPLEKLMGMATDWASVMKGERNGVTNMKNKTPMEVEGISRLSWCLPHKQRKLRPWSCLVLLP